MTFKGGIIKMKIILDREQIICCIIDSITKEEGYKDCEFDVEFNILLDDIIMKIYITEEEEND